MTVDGRMNGSAGWMDEWMEVEVDMYLWCVYDEWMNEDMVE